MSEVPVAAPMFGVTSVGVLAKTSDPVPVSSEMTPASSEEDVAARADSLSVVTTSVLLEGMLVPLIDVALAAPREGVVRLGEVESTTDPVPVEVVTPVPPFATATVPVSPTVTAASPFVTAMFVPAVSLAAFHSESVLSRISNEPEAGGAVICTS